MINKIYLDNLGFIFHTRTVYTEDPDPGEGIIVPDPVDFRTQYYDHLTETIKNKAIPEYIITTVDDTTTISGLPDPSIITIDKVEYTITDGELELAFDTPGLHTVLIQSILYLDKGIIIET